MHRLKCCVVGDAGVGKTSLIHAFMDKSVDAVKTTMGIDFFSKSMYVQTTTVHLTLWDTAGAERYRSLMHSYLRDSHVIMIVYDVTNPHSSIVRWLHLADQFKPKVVCVVGNKNDLTALRRNVAELLVPWQRQRCRLITGHCSSRVPTSVKKIVANCVEAVVGTDGAPCINPAFDPVRFVQKRPHSQKCCT
jgi:Ras-related protein Rab-6A